ncbi:MAG: hypothetical protein Q9170_004646 [Blastenia crenularia]
MANGHSNSTIFGPDLSLTPDQRSLLRTALSSNNPNTSRQVPYAMSTSPNGSGPTARNRSTNSNRMQSSPQNDSMYHSPLQNMNSSLVDSFPADDSPFTDGQDFEDANFEWENNEDQLFGDIPGAPDYEEDDIHDKRKNGEEEDGKNKRHEGGDKNNKKPGRKPLNSSEPTTKRKAQNRAAQRAFRERKERHLKDLEAKVDDLEKASETTNHENGRLRATVERLNTEVKEYRKRLSLNTTAYSPPAAPVSHKISSNNDFQFAFPKFGDLPGSTFMSNGSLARISTPNRISSRTTSGNIPGIVRAGSSSSVNSKSPSNNMISPVNQNGKASTIPSPIGGIQASPTSFQGTTMEDLNGLFSPSMLASASRSNSSDYTFPVTDRPAPLATKQSSTESPAASDPASNKHRTSSTSITASPSVSSMSHGGVDSSTGTTPEPSADSPENRKASEGTLNTINEESAPRDSVGDKNTFCDEWATACGDTMNRETASNPQATNTSAQRLSAMITPSNNVSGIDWMAQQNGGLFDPVLFGDYRDTQNDLFTNEFFNEAFLNQDFSTPFNVPEELSPAPKKDLMQQVEEQQGSGDNGVVAGDDAKELLTCDKVWLVIRRCNDKPLLISYRDRVQQSEKAQSGEVDMDNLCSQLKSKAKCSANKDQAVYERKDIDAIVGPSIGEKDYLQMFK